MHNAHRRRFVQKFLRDEKFEELFKMTKAEFYKLALWRQRAAKKTHKLF